MAVDRQIADAAYAQWQGGVDVGKLTKKSAEGLDVQPLYVDGHVDGLAATGWPGQAPFVRGASVTPGWLPCQRYASGDAQALSASVRRDVAGGARAVWLCFDRATRAGWEPDDPRFESDALRDGVWLGGARDLTSTLKSRPEALFLDAGVAALPVAATAIAAAKQAGDRTPRLFFGADPLGAFASDGALGTALDRAETEMALLARHAHDHVPGARAITISTAPHHGAGADGSLELGYAMATLVEYLRALTGAGMSTGAAAEQVALSFAIGRDVFMELAKLRAARLLWSKVLTACGAGAVPAPFTLAVTSPRALTRRDPYNNLLRGTAQTFAAIVGGADAIATMPFDVALGEPEALGRRMSQNTQLVLGRESHLGQVLDAAGGSHYIERLTDELARAAWGHLQRIEAAGGMRQHLLGGGVAEELSKSWDARARAVSRRKVAVTGVSEFAAVDEARLERAPTRSAAAVDAVVKQARAQGGGAGATTDRDVDALIRAASDGASPWALRRRLGRGDSPEPLDALPRHREAEAFEALRDRADALGGDARPTVLLVKLGPTAEHKARETFAIGFFAAGGLRCVDVEASDANTLRAALDASGARIACLCGADERYAEDAAGVGRALVEAGAAAIVLAGRPGEHESAWRDAGIERFIHLGADAVPLLTELLDVAEGRRPGDAKGGAA